MDGRLSEPSDIVRAMSGADTSHGVGAPAADAVDQLAALRGGDEEAFERLIHAHHAAMVRLAMVYVPSRSVAEEVVQETWLAVLQGLERFEGRSSLKTWIFRILMNQAMTRGQREHRTLPFSAVFDPAKEPAEPPVDPDRFMDAAARYPGQWAHPPRTWEAPEDRLLSRETLDHVGKAIDTLPPSQREVIILRDVEGWTSREVCNVLGISGTNQRVLLHRARSKVRRALEQYFDEGA
jgi:RNA polymerase sigma-70 factor (ECF subfamily)